MAKELDPKKAEQPQAGAKAKDTKSTAEAKPAEVKSTTAKPADNKEPDTKKPAPPKKKIDPEQLRLKKEAQARASRRRNRQLLGVVLSILVLVGAVSIVVSGINLVEGMLNDTSELKEYETRLEPMVWFDVLPFEAPDQIDENTLKEIAIWGILNEKGQTLERNELDEPLIPRLDVDLYAANLFGPEFQFSGHESFVDREWDLRYTYNPTTDMYTAPSTSLQPPYLPVVQEIVRESGGIKRVIVGYVSTMGSDDQMIATPDRDHPVRYMDFLFRRDGNNYYLYAMQPNTTYVPTAASSEAQPAAASSDGGIASSLPPVGEEELLASSAAGTTDSTAASTAEDSAAA